jgi:hypothetical protein
MRKAFLAALISCTSLAVAQITSSESLGCTVVPGGGMACNGIGVPFTKHQKPKLPRLSITHFTFEPEAVIDRVASSSDSLIVGINGGDLLNEKPPGRHISLEKDFVTLMPKGEPFRLRNTGTERVEFRLIEIRR